MNYEKTREALDTICECIANLDGIAGIIDIIGGANYSVQPKNQENMCYILSGNLLRAKDSLGGVVDILEQELVK